MTELEHDGLEMTNQTSNEPLDIENQKERVRRGQSRVLGIIDALEAEAAREEVEHGELSHLDYCLEKAVEYLEVGLSVTSAVLSSGSQKHKIAMVLQLHSYGISKFYGHDLSEQCRAIDEIDDLLQKARELAEETEQTPSKPGG